MCFHWWVTSEVTGRRVKTRYAMPVEVALAQWPGAEPVGGSLEVREIPETDAEPRRSLYKRLAAWRAPDGPPRG